MRLKTILFMCLVTANAYAYDRQDNDVNAVAIAKSHYRNSQPVIDLNSEDYDTMVTSINANNEAVAIPEDSMANYSNTDDGDDY